MANARGWMSCSAVLVILLSTGAAAHAAHAARPDPAATPADAVPEALRPWIGWVLHGDAEEQLACPQLNGREDDRVCAWPARLSLAVTDKGGTFSQEWEVFHAGLAKLPGSDEHWPLDVRVDGKPAAVVSSDDDPALELAPGHHQVTGRFAWDESPPDSVAVPPETGLLALTVNGKRVDFPVRDEEGQVFFGRNVEEVAEADSIDISVHRKLVDDVPLRLITRLQLAVSGKNREVVLGRALPAGFEAQEVEGGLPLRFDPDGHVRIQVRPGTWTILVTARRVAAGDSVTRPQPDGLWKDGEEVWVFESHPELRVVELSGAPAIDPAQTTLPDEWKALPAYALPAGATLALAERRRGDSDAGPDQLQLERRLWLDFDGGGYTVSDQISGRFTRSWRLAGAAHTRLGRVAINGQDQFITRDADGHEGVEIRSGRANISADSRIEGRRWHVPATSFLLDFQSVSTVLMIPPGWRLIHATGADKVTGTWIDRWSLLSFFLLLVTTLAAQRLFGSGLALVAFVGIGLSITESDAPAAVWLAVLLGEALARALRTGKLHTVARWYRIGAWIALASILFPYAVAEVRRGVHPAAERELLEGGAGEGYVRARDERGASPCARGSLRPARRRACAQRGRRPQRRFPCRLVGRSQGDGAKEGRGLPAGRTGWLLRVPGPAPEQGRLAESCRLRPERRRADRSWASDLELGLGLADVQCAGSPGSGAATVAGAAAGEPGAVAGARGAADRAGAADPAPADAPAGRVAGGAAAARRRWNRAGAAPLDDRSAGGLVRRGARGGAERRRRRSCSSN